MSTHLVLDGTHHHAAMHKYIHPFLYTTKKTKTLQHLHKESCCLGDEVVSWLQESFSTRSAPPLQLHEPSIQRLHVAFLSNWNWSKSWSMHSFKVHSLKENHGYDSIGSVVPESF